MGSYRKYRKEHKQKRRVLGGITKVYREEATVRGQQRREQGFQERKMRGTREQLHGSSRHPVLTESTGDVGAEAGVYSARPEASEESKSCKPGCCLEQGS